MNILRRMWRIFKECFGVPFTDTVLVENTPPDAPPTYIYRIVRVRETGVYRIQEYQHTDGRFWAMGPDFDSIPAAYAYIVKGL